MAPMQRSLESPAMRGVPINYQERRIWHFHEQIDRIIGPERIPAELGVPSLLSDYVEHEPGRPGHCRPATTRTVPSPHPDGQMPGVVERPDGAFARWAARIRLTDM